MPWRFRSLVYRMGISEVIHLEHGSQGPIHPQSLILEGWVDWRIYISEDFLRTVATDGSEPTRPEEGCGLDQSLFLAVAWAASPTTNPHTLGCAVSPLAVGQAVQVITERIGKS